MEGIASLGLSESATNTHYMCAYLMHVHKAIIYWDITAPCLGSNALILTFIRLPLYYTVEFSCADKIPQKAIITALSINNTTSFYPRKIFLCTGLSKDQVFSRLENTLKTGNYLATANLPHFVAIVRKGGNSPWR